MSAHARARGTLAAWTPPTQRDAALRERYLAHLDSRPDGLERECFPDHLTAGVIVVSAPGDAVLLNHHRKAGAWLAFGGHLEPEDGSLEEAARRELVEESGLREFVLDPEPLSLDEHAVDFCSDRGTVHHLDVRFLAVADRDAEHGASAESLDVRWWPADALPDTFEDMYLLIGAALARRRQSVPAAGSPSLGGGSSRAAAE